MRKLNTLFVAVLLSVGVFAQSPEKMSYQAVIRNSNNALVTNTQVGMQISILQGTTEGVPVYVETQTPTTNANGLVSFEIGSDNAAIVSGNFSTIDWSAGPYFIKTDTDPSGATNYTITGTSQLLSVPYALHAKTAENITGDQDGSETKVTAGTNVIVSGSGTKVLPYIVSTIDTLADKVVLLSGAQTVAGGKTFINGFNTHYIELNSFNTGNRNAFIDFHGDDTYTDYSLRLIRTNTGMSLLDHRGIGAMRVQASDSGSVQFATRGNVRMNIDAIGNINMQNNQVINVKTPVNANDAANKAYVDAKYHNLKIGDSYGGGIIFWLDATGQHGLIAATNDQSTLMKWHISTSSIIGVELNAIYSGMSNTNNIIAKLGAGSYAAQLCAEYSVTVNNEYYDDWYLPSIYELSLLFLQKNAVGGFSSLAYWSSTENDIDYAWVLHFGSGSSVKYSKSSNCRVRAIRAF